ncbi:Xaa-Pro peptidase family protein [Anaerospora sp.]|uniref:M24 family metallopeptidase n=1 Tax=Anaerospora sp. TaxID=1960278 RepID=UPI0028A0718A|nr:Xaa-Pro peptidase family protein [Anaerospora sp.]
MNNRIERLRELCTNKGLEGFIVTKPENRLYFSGFCGSSGLLLVTGNDAKLLTDFRYVTQAQSQAPDFEIVRHGVAILKTLGQTASNLEVKKLGFEMDYVTWADYQAMERELSGIELIPCRVDELRMMKDEAEITALKRAVFIADQAFSHILKYIRPGMTEREVALELEYTMRRLGAEKSAFDIIVASGVRSSLPHGIASEKIIANGDFVTMDFGAVYNGYHSDITRTIIMGQASDKQRQIYEIVLQAQLAGVAAVQPGRTGKQIDEVSRSIITNAGYGNYFGHGLGHGVGLNIHEEPRLSPGGDTMLEAAMTVTVEPGIYIPEWGGVRIEDTVVVVSAGCEVLTASSKQLIQVER